MKNQSMFHISMYVKDVQKTVAFYNQFFEKEATKVKPGYAKYELENEGLVISFVENAERVAEGFGHLGFRLESKEEVLKKLELSKSQGMWIKEEMGTACCYALQDKFWVADPDGHQWEVYYFHEDVEFNDPRYSDGQEVACCSPEMETKPAKEKIALAELSASKEGASCEPGSGCC